MCTACRAATIDEQRLDAFGEELLRTVNASAKAIMISVGHRTGLFDAMAHAGPLTVPALADRASLSDRYVREWLGAMTCARVVEHDAEAMTYRLPDEHAALLTRAAAPNNLATVMQWVSVMGSVENEVVEAFEHGRGVAYEAYERFPEVMAEESGQSVVAALDEHILPLVPGLRERLEAGIDVLDVGCGRGHALLHLARAFPSSRFVGYDLLHAHAEHASAAAREHALENVRFEVRDAAAMDDRDAFDWVTTFDAIHDQARPDLAVANIRRALRGGGVYLCQEIRAETAHADNVEHPAGTFVYAISTMHCMSVSLASGGLGLGAAWGRDACRQMLEGAGFAVEMHELDHDPLNDFWVCR